MTSDEDARLVRRLLGRIQWIHETLNDPALSVESARVLVTDGEGSEILVFAHELRLQGHEQVDELQRADLRARLVRAWRVLAGVSDDAERARAVREELRLSGEKLSEYVDGTQVDLEQMVDATVAAIRYRDPDLGARAHAARSVIASALELYDRNRGGKRKVAAEKVEDRVRAVLAALGLPRKPPNRSPR